MAVTQVRAQINGTWYNLALDSATGKYFVDLTLTDIGTFSATVEASSNAAPTVTLSGAGYPALRLVVEDTVAPTLTVTAPTNGLVTAATSVTVSGTAFDTSGISSLTINGTAVAVAADGSFSATVNLTSGSNTIAVVATDNSGNAATETRTVTRATSGPTLEITSPAEGALLQAGTVAVSGTVSDSVSPVATVTVNGVAAAISGNTWTASVPLSEGANTLTAVGTNQVGLSTTKTRTVTRDSTAPVLTITAPENNLVTAAEEITVSGTVSDVGPVTVTVNETPVTVTGGAFTAAVQLEGGSNTITVTATDEAGNITTDTRTVIRATQGPSVTILSPVAGFITNESSLLVTGTVSDSVALVSGVTVNGAAADLSSGTFSATVSLTEGDNTITVVGTNHVGLTTTETVSGTLDTIPPEITLTDPTAGQMVSEAAFTVTGTVSDENLSGVTVNGTAATVTDGTFSLEITLAEGANAVTATATDAAGNTASATGSVLLDTIPPALTVTAPAGDLITNQPTLTVAGTASDSGSGVDEVTVDGQPVTLTDGAYSTEITLTEGPNTVTVAATDKVGHTTTVTRSVLLDTAPPVLALVSPPAGFLDTATPTVIFSVVDEPGGSGVDLDTVAVLVDGQPHAAAVADGTITITPTLADGAHVVTVTVEDVAGNQRGLSASYTVDTVPPVLYLREPYYRHVVDDAAVEIVVDAWDEGTGVASVTAGGQTLTGTGPYKGIVPLDVGENTVTVTAADYAGNQITAQVYLIRLITDRTQADVNAVNALAGRSWDSFSDAEKAFWMGVVRGAYNDEDMNRVGTAVAYLSQLMSQAGYLPDTNPKTDWDEYDGPTPEQRQTYLDNVAKLQAQFPVPEPKVPPDMEEFRFQEANDVEKILVNVDSIFPLLERSVIYSGEAFAGEF